MVHTAEVKVVTTGPSGRTRLRFYHKLVERQAALQGLTLYPKTFDEGMTEKVSVMRYGYSWYSATHLNMSWFAVAVPAKATAMSILFGEKSHTHAQITQEIHATK